MALSGTIYGSVTQKSGVFSFYLTWSAVQNIAENYSDVTVKTYWSTNNRYDEFDTVGARAASITINGETVSISKVFEVYWRSLGTSTYLIQTATKRVYHNSDGSKSITISARANGHAAIYGPSASNTTAGDCTASGTVTLNAIPRATTPTLSVTTQTMGSAMTITLSPASSGFKHKIRYSFGSLANQTAGLSIGGDFSATGNTTVTFIPPTSLANQIPKDPYGLCTIYCYTYNSSGTQIGNAMPVTIKLNVPSYTPTATITLSGNSLLNGAYVQGKSTVTVTINAPTTNLYGATISSYSSVIDGVTYTEQTFTSKALSNGNKTVKTTITDSRGKPVEVNSASIVVYEYTAPVITGFTLERQSDEKTVIATLQGSVASVNNKNAKTFQVTLNGVTQTITSTSYTVNGTTTFTNVPTDNTLTATAKITDSYTSATREAVLPTVAVTMDFYKDGKGVAFGKVAETSGLLDVAWEIKTGRPAETLNNFSFRGANITIEDADNSVSNWAKQGNLSTFFYSDSSQGITKPSTWGFLLNTSRRMGDSEVHQLWLEQPDGNIHHRGGNVLGFNKWRKVLDDTNCADYVIEQGVSSNWNYSKWNSGKVEAWRRIEIGSASLTTSMTTGIWSNDTFKSRDVSLPTGMFIEAPIAFINANSSGYTNSQVSATTKDTVTYRLWATYSGATISNCFVSLYVIGKWK